MKRQFSDSFVNWGIEGALSNNNNNNKQKSLPPPTTTGNSRKKKKSNNVSSSAEANPTGLYMTTGKR